MAEFIYERRSGAQTLDMLDDIADLYDEIRSEYIERHDIFSRASFVTRTDSQARKPGFDLITAASHGLLAGFSFGYPIPSGDWWSECSPPPPDVLNSAKFAVIELDVRKEYRRRGIGKRLLDMLLGSRDEKFATLACLRGSSAQAMYERWGWYKVATFEDLPPMDAMLIPLESKAPDPLK